MPAWPKIWMLNAGMLFILSPSVWAANLALIIGNNQYGNGIDSLANPINDAQAIDAQLKRLGFQTTLVKNADKIQMLEAIDDFSQKINRGDTVLFFYAGHGASANGNNYLIPSKAAIPRSDNWMDEHFIDLDTKVASRLSQSLASYTLVVMDACRDNPIARTRSTGTRAFARTDVSQNAAGLSFLYSASKGQQAQDGRGGNSPFTAALINKLKVPNLKWPELVDDVAQDVRQQTKNQQEVWQEGNTLARFVLNAQAGAPSQQQVEKPVERIVERDSPHAAEIAAWNDIKSSSRASDYQSYLSRYPSGLFAEAAQLRLGSLSSSSDLQARNNRQPAPAPIEVRIPPSPTSARPALSADEQLMSQGMWRDPKTNMIWMRCSLGQTWNGTTCTGEASKHDWQAAQGAVAAMNRNGGYGGYTDWVLPHIEDLSSIRYCSTGFEKTSEIPAKHGGSKTIDNLCKGDNYQRPTIDQAIFPNTPAYMYWSASPHADRNSAAWIVSFGYCITSYHLKYNYLRVRAVRAGYEQ